MKDGVEDLDIKLLHSEQLLLGLVEGERAGVDPPQPVAGDDGGHGRRQVGPVTLLVLILLRVIYKPLMLYSWIFNPSLQDLFLFSPLKGVSQI